MLVPVRRPLSQIGVTSTAQPVSAARYGSALAQSALDWIALQPGLGRFVADASGNVARKCTSLFLPPLLYVRMVPGCLVVRFSALTAMRGVRREIRQTLSHAISLGLPVMPQVEFTRE
jgi:hypothetical protein